MYHDWSMFITVFPKWLECHKTHYNCFSGNAFYEIPTIFDFRFFDFSIFLVGKNWLTLPSGIATFAYFYFVLQQKNDIQ
jgi:hypothetical protein